MQVAGLWCNNIEPPGRLALLGAQCTSALPQAQETRMHRSLAETPHRLLYAHCPVFLLLLGWQQNQGGRQQGSTTRVLTCHAADARLQLMSVRNAGDNDVALCFGGIITTVSCCGYCNHTIPAPDSNHLTQ